MKRRFLLFVFLIAFMTQALATEPFYLFKDGQPMAVIVAPSDALELPGARMSRTRPNQMVPADVPSDMARAIEEFRRDVREGYGVDLPLVTAGTATAFSNRVELVVEARPLLTEDDTTIDFPSTNVLRITGGGSGVRRELFRLLEEFGGARYLFQGDRNDIGIGAYFPVRADLAIPRQARHWTPAFPLHRGSIVTCSQSHSPGRLNRPYFWNWEMRLGAKARAATAHMRIPFPLVQYADAEEKPPEEIFPILHGERYLAWKYPKNYSHWQPRYSSPVAVDEAVKNILAYLRKYPGVTSVGLGVNDEGGHSEDERGRESETYYSWVNAVAERVAAEFPDIVLTVIAYREVQTPPPFKLHANVVSILCFDMHSCLDSGIRAGREKLIREWSKVARIGHYGYNNGDHVYKLPRIYFGILQEMIQFFHEQGAEHAFCERSYTPATEGPKMYLYYKLLEDPYLDVDATVRDWCEAAVGEEAAPLLYAYYSFWDEFWRTKVIHTSWWKSGKDNIYLPYSRFGSFMYALEPGDMARCRQWMESVVSLAGAHGTPSQKARADFLMQTFEWYEANATAICAEYVAANGMIPDRDAALGLLHSIPAAQAAAEKSFRLPYETRGWIAPGLVTQGRLPSLPEDTRGRNASVVAGSLALVSGFLADEAVVEELETVARNRELVGEIRVLAGMLLRAAKGDDSGNLVQNGGFEADAQGWAMGMPIYGRIGRSSEVVFEGANALKCDINHENFHVLYRVLDAQPDTRYFCSARVFIPEDQAVAEGRLNIRGSMQYLREDGTYGNRNHTSNIPDIVLKPGQWNYVSCTIPGAELRPDRDRGVDALELRIFLKHFEQGDVAYIDDVQVLPITDE